MAENRLVDSPASRTMTKEGMIAEEHFSEDRPCILCNIERSPTDLSAKTGKDLSVTSWMSGLDTEHPIWTIPVTTERVLRYLKGIVDNCLALRASDHTQFSLFLDSSWRSNIKQQRGSCSELLIQNADTYMYTTSFAQKGISLSSTEGEYAALSDTTRTIT